MSDAWPWAAVAITLAEAGLLVFSNRRRWRVLTWATVIGLVYLAWCLAALALDPAPVSPRGLVVVRGVLAVEFVRVISQAARWLSWALRGANAG